MRLAVSLQSPVPPVLMALALALAATAGRSGAVPSPTWEDFAANSGTATQPILPDFSYSGYRQGEVGIPTVAHTVFDVTSYGAIPNDGQMDGPAIQAAIVAAEANGSGIVFFPPGRFHLNTASDVGTSIMIHGSNIVLRGSGQGPGGTELFMERNFEPASPTDLASTPFMFIAVPTVVGDPTRATITANAARGTRILQVSTISGLVAGDWVSLYLTDIDAVPDFLAPYSADPAWTDLSTSGILVRERHRIESIGVGTVTLREPLLTDIDATHDWTLRGYRRMEELGFEDIAFIGNWQGPFVHHRSALDDGGWSALDITRAVNSWIRRCTFTNWNYGVFLDTCSAFSILQVTLDGTPGHHSIHARRGTGVLVGLSRDFSSHWHGPSMGYQSASTVYWRYGYNSDSSFDSHGSQPYSTLLDVVSGGLKYGRCGGSIADMPNHLRHFVMWNYNGTGSPVSNFNFWQTSGSRQIFVKPIIVGFHGASTTFNASALQLLESYGTPVEPESLYEAQLALRLGALPPWIQDAKGEWEAIKAGIPIPTLTTPATNTVIMPGDSLAMAASIPAEQLAATARVEFLEGDNVLGNDTSSPFGFTWPSAPYGTYALRARALSTGGDEGFSGTVIVYAGLLPQPEAIPTGLTVSDAQDPNLGPNAIDDDFGTRWSAEGDGQWISFDLGGVIPVNRIDLAWHQGDLRRASFSLELSDNGTDWSRMLDTESNGTTTGFETHYFVGGPARYVRIVGHGNTVNDWNSITEAAIFSPTDGAAQVQEWWMVQ